MFSQRTTPGSLRSQPDCRRAGSLFLSEFSTTCLAPVSPCDPAFPVPVTGYFHTTFCARFRLHRNRKTDPLPSLAHCCPPQHKGEFGQCKRVSPSAAFLIADALDNAGAFGAIHHHVLHVPALWRRQGQRHRVPPWRGDGGPAVVRRGAEIQQ